MAAPNSYLDLSNPSEDLAMEDHYSYSHANISYSTHASEANITVTRMAHCGACSTGQYS